ncbi:VWA domain-containing protein [Enterovibrio makurazakiensis]|uniref:vWA domain-containing protein n=1 Tax=Enterovibrio makurazakiensis TaxID=2910232 RepID=UPI003D24EB39
MADFTFMHPTWLLALLPLALLLPWVQGKAKKSGLIAPHLSALLSGNQTTNNKPKRWPTVVLASAWVLSVIALAGPSWQKTELPAVNLAGARVLVMNMSRSMYATDIAPNRLSQARFKALDMLPGWKEGSTGLVTYAGDGYIVSPLTEDAATLKNLIPNLSPAIMPIPGSNAAAGITQAMDLLKQAGYAQGDIVLITDGLSQSESNATLKVLDGSDYRVSVLAVGTQQGAPIKLPNGKMLEQNGTPVIAKLDLNTLQAITKKTGGILQIWQASNRDVDNLVAFTAKPLDGKADGKNKTIEERINDGFWLIIPIMLLSLFGFRKGVVLVALFVVMPIKPVSAAAFKTDDQQAYEQFESGDYQGAASTFTSPSWKGIAQYKAGDFNGAIETLSTLTDPVSQYNLGNALAQSGDLEAAQETYESLLKQDPNNADAKHNLDVVKKALEQQQQQQQDQNQNGDQQQDGEGDQSQDQQNGQQNDQPQNGDQSGQPQDSQGQDQQSDQQSSSSDQSQSQNADANQQDGESQQGNDAQLGEANSDPQEQAQGQDGEQDQEGQQGEQEQQEGREGTTEQSEEEGDQPAAIASESGESGSGSDALTANHPVLKKLEQVNDDTAALIRAQLMLQAREKDMPKPAENSW